MEALYGSRAVYVDGRGDIVEVSWKEAKKIIGIVNNHTKVKIKANVSQKLTDKTNVDRLVLEDVIVDGSYFRDHVWVKNTKRLSGLSIGDEFTATALVYVYSSSEGKKLGLKTFREVEKI